MNYPFEAVRQECSDVRNSCGWTEIERTIIRVNGSDRAQFLHNFCTNDIKKLTTGTGCEAFFTNVQGRTIGHGVILAAQDCIWVDTVGGQDDFLTTHLNRYLITEDATIESDTDQFTSFVLAGPASDGILSPLVAGIPRVMNEHAPLIDRDGRITRVDFTELPTFLLTVARSDAQRMREQLADSKAIPIAEDTFHVLRVQHRYPWFGMDITADNLPQEVDRDASAISFTKGCYLGQETVARLDALGHVNRLLRRIELSTCDPSAVPQPLDEIFTDDKKVGTLGSVVSNPDDSSGNSRLALAYLRVEYAEPETELSTTFGKITVK